MAPVASSLSAFVTLRRKKLNLRQNDLAKALGYTVQAISKFESGESQLAITSLPALANLLSLSLDDLILAQEGPIPAVANSPLDLELLRNNIVTLRNNAHLSLAKEAEILGVSKNTVIHYEAGSSLLSYEALCQMMAYYSLTAKALLYEPVAPLVLQTPLVVPPPKKKPFVQKPIVLIALIIAFVSVVLGVVMPLFLNQQTAAKDTFSSFSSSGSLTSSSNSSSASISSSGSSDASISSSVDLTPDLSINIPGLKELHLRMKANPDASTFELIPGDYVVEVYSGDFVFSEANKNQYQFEVYLTDRNRPSGVSLNDTENYLEKSLHVPTTLNSGVAFALQVRAWSLLHPTEFIQEPGCSLAVTVLNPAGADLNENFVGLKALDVTINGIKGSPLLSPGTYPVSYVSTPEEYFETHDCVLTYEITQAVSGISIAQDGKSVTIAPNVSNSTSCQIKLLAVNSSRKALSKEGSFTVNNPTGDLDSECFPGIKDFSMLYQGGLTPTLGPGEYKLELSIVSDGTLDLSSEDFVMQLGSAGTWTGGMNGDPFRVEIVSEYPFGFTLYVSSGYASGLYTRLFPYLFRKSYNRGLEGRHFLVTLA